MENMGKKGLASRLDGVYYAKSIFGIVLMFGFGYLPPIEGLTSTGMQIIGIFLGLLFLWSAVEIAWPSILGIIAFGMSDYGTMNSAIMQGLGSPVVWQLMMIIYIIMACGLGEFIIPFKGWQLALCLAFNDVSGIVLNYSLYIAVSFVVGSIMVISMGLSTRYIFRADLTKLQNFDVTVLENSGIQKLNYRQKSYFYTFIFIIVSTVATTWMPADWAIVQLFNKLTLSGVFALAVVALCLIKIDGSPLMKFNEVAKEGIKWEIILICASILPLASALTSDKTGIIQMCSAVFAPLLEGKSSGLILVIIILVTLVGTNIGSNTGIALLIIPIAIPICKLMGLSMEIMGIAIIYTACMGFILPGSSALSAVGYTNDWVKPKEMMKYTSFACVVYGIVAIPLYLIVNLMV